MGSRHRPDIRPHLRDCRRRHRLWRADNRHHRPGRPNTGHRDNRRGRRLYRVVRGHQHRHHPDLRPHLRGHHSSRRRWRADNRHHRPGRPNTGHRDNRRGRRLYRVVRGHQHRHYPDLRPHLRSSHRRGRRWRTDNRHHRPGHPNTGHRDNRRGRRLYRVVRGHQHRHYPDLRPHLRSSHRRGRRWRTDNRHHRPGHPNTGHRDNRRGRRLYRTGGGQRHRHHPDLRPHLRDSRRRL